VGAPVSAEWILPLAQGFAVAYGLVIGSFLAVCIVRLPEDRSLLTPSSCERCGRRLSWWENVPLVSYVALRGRCRTCGTAIPPIHPLTELLGGLLAWLVFRRVFTDPADLDLAHVGLWVVLFGFVSLLVVAAAVDVRHRIIPDETSIYAIPFGILAVAFVEWQGLASALAPGWRHAVLGVALWGGAFAAFAVVVEWVAGRVALGWGDVKLVAMLAAFLGIWPGTFVVVLWGSLFGAITGIVVTLALRRRAYLPFGPPLAVAATLWVLYGEQLLPGL
jgi:leader peptidase (prepilin peptidase)/N-methyltransferase